MSNLNVIIDSNGNVYDAIPSHQKTIEKIIGITTQEVAKRMTQDEIKYFQFSLAKRTRCLMVWENEVCGIPNELQVKTLRTLKMSGKYNGAVPFVDEECNIYLRSII